MHSSKHLGVYATLPSSDHTIITRMIFGPSHVSLSDIVLLKKVTYAIINHHHEFKLPAMLFSMKRYFTIQHFLLPHLLILPHLLLLLSLLSFFKKLFPWLLNHNHAHYHLLIHLFTNTPFHPIHHQLPFHLLPHHIIWVLIWVLDPSKLVQSILIIDLLTTVNIPWQHELAPTH